MLILHGRVLVKKDKEKFVGALTPAWSHLIKNNLQSVNKIYMNLMPNVNKNLIIALTDSPQLELLLFLTWFVNMKRLSLFHMWLS
jgi:hypothetical protein